MIYLKVLFITVEVISSILLIAIILLQRPKSEGLGMAFGSEMGESLFGARASNVLTKVTVWVGVIFVANTIALARIYRSSAGYSLMSGRSGQVEEAPSQSAVPYGVLPKQNSSSLPESPEPAIPLAPQSP